MPNRQVTMVEGVPTDSQIEEMLDAMGIPEDDVVAEAEEMPVEMPEEEVLPEEAPEEAPEEEPELEPDDETGGGVDGLGVALGRAMANTFAMYLRAHVFHWNVTGPDFVQYHQYLDTLSSELYAAVDPMAEHLRAEQLFAPSGLAEFVSLSTVADPGTPAPPAEEMWSELLAANDEVLNALALAFEEAGDDQGLLNFLGDRLDAHAKHGWFLRSLMGTAP